MNIRSLTRGDGVVIGAAALLFIASLLDFHSATLVSANAWNTDFSGLALPSVFLLGFIAAGLLVATRFVPEGRKIAGLPLSAWGIVLAVSAAWSGLWTLILNGSNGAGAILGFLAVAVLAGVALAGAKIPALAGQLVPDPKPVAAPPYGGQPQPGAGYGYPGAPEGRQAQPYGNTPQPAPPYGGTPQDAGQTPAPTPEPAPAADFSPFWFAVPVARPLFAEDGSPNPIAELAPGTWYLAVEQRGPATLIAQTQDGRRGVLNDTSGIQRG
ncbi:hypothetical protein [Streptomyces sp. NPDC059874]|uniref:hypothetical protein n=1 Tax=Streptomyces sp. NPDC059874 TaxID=3346983 RepID=UPI0036489C3B